MRNLKQITSLTDKANKLLSAANTSQVKWEEMLRYNVEVAEPNEFTPISDDKLQFQWFVTQRIMRSYQVVINQINDILCSAL